MTIIYGFRGQPAASIIGEAVYGRDGRQIGFLHENHMFRCEDGCWVGSFCSGVVFNAYGRPEGFSDGASERALPLTPPKIEAMLPPKMISSGEDIRGLAGKRPPAFLQMEAGWLA